MAVAISHSASTRGLKRTHIGASSTVTGTMIKVTWTDAQVVKFTAQKFFKHLCAFVSKVQDRYSIEGYDMFSFYAGKTYHLVHSGFENYYYIVSIEKQTCFCPAGRTKHACKHLDMAVAYDLANVKVKKEEAPQVCKRSEEMSHVPEIKLAGLKAGDTVTVLVDAKDCSSRHFLNNRILDAFQSGNGAINVARWKKLKLAVEVDGIVDDINELYWRIAETETFYNYRERITYTREMLQLSEDLIFVEVTLA